MALLRIVIPLRCSSSIESRYLIVPANRSEMIPLCSQSESARVVLPWSTCAAMVTRRVWLGAGRIDDIGTRTTVGIIRNLWKPLLFFCASEQGMKGSRVVEMSAKVN